MKLIRVKKKDGDYQSLTEIIKTVRRAEKLGASHSQIQLDPESGDYQKCKQILLDNGYKLVKKTGNPNMTVYEVWEFRKPAKDSKKSDNYSDELLDGLVTLFNIDSTIKALDNLSDYELSLLESYIVRCKKNIDKILKVIKDKKKG